MSPTGRTRRAQHCSSRQLSSRYQSALSGPRHHPAIGAVWRALVAAPAAAWLSGSRVAERWIERFSREIDPPPATGCEPANMRKSPAARPLLSYLHSSSISILIVIATFGWLALAEARVSEK